MSEGQDVPVGASSDAVAVERPRASVGVRLARWLEVLVLFAALPTLYAQNHRVVPLLAVLPTAGLLALAALLLDPSFDRRSLWRARAAWREMPRILATFVIGAALLTAGVLLFEPDNLFAFPRENPRMWAIVMVFYPLLSVYPQELVFRTLLFHRARPIVATAAGVVALSGAAFGYAHLMFKDPFVAVTMTAVGGVLFAWTYHRTKSTLAAAIEHALFGNFIFTIGLGNYFFTGTIA